MVSKKVEIVTKSYKEGAVPMKWSCDGTPEYSLEETTKEDRGTDIILYIDLILAFQPREPQENKFLLFMPPSLWYSVMAALAN